MPVQIAEPVRTFLARRYGRLRRAERLGGQSLSAVYRLHFGIEDKPLSSNDYESKTLSHNRTRILKVSDRPAENYFYRRVAPQLERQGVVMPRLDYAITAAGRSWLVLEDIGAALPRERWAADPDVLATLYRLHSAKLDIAPRLPFYRPVWTPELNRQATVILADGIKLLPMLDELAMRYSYLFESVCPVSGDPNPTNWGVRPDAAPVLYDWERFTYATPALDLGIVVPGLPSRPDFEAVARLYSAHSGTDLFTLSRDMLAVKLWSIVEYVAGYATGKMRRSVQLDGQFLNLLAVYLSKMSREL